MGIDPMGTFELFTLIAIAALVVLSIVDEIISDKWGGEPRKDINVCVAEWAEGEGNYSTDTENGAIIMSTVIDGDMYYYIDRTYYGGYTMVLPFIFSYIKYGLQSLFDKNKQMVGFVHTHSFKVCPFDPSEADKFISTLPGMKEMYVIGSTTSPWSASGTPVKGYELTHLNERLKETYGDKCIRMLEYDCKKSFFKALRDMICGIPGYLD